MANITINKLSENQLYIFQVTIDDQGSQTKHRVSLNKADYQRITQGKVKPDILIAKAFEFLLEHEAKESILPEFDFTIISRYFPTFNKEIKIRISNHLSV